MSDRSLVGKTAVVTGAARGIGKAAALLLAKHGCNLILSGRDSGTLRSLAEEIKTLGGEAALVEADLRGAGTPELLISQAQANFGCLDILVNCAGLAKAVPLLDLDLATWQDFFDLHLTATFRCSQAVARDMIARKREGSIVNLSSTAASMAMYGNGAYGAAKAAVSSLTRTLAIELAPHRITVNAVAPGPVATETLRAVYDEAKYRARSRAIPLNRLAEPEEVAQIIAFLASPSARYISGQTFVIDGGASAVGCYSFETFKRNGESEC